MSYEYQKDIKESILEKYRKHPRNVFKRQDELDRIYAQAAKADEYEAKAKSYTKLVSQISAVDEIVASNYDKDMTDTNLHLLMLGAEVKKFFESGEPYA